MWQNTFTTLHSAFARWSRLGLWRRLGRRLALDWRLFLILVAGVAVITFITDYMFIGTLSASVGYLVWCILTGRSGWDIAIMAATVALIFWKHRKNFARLVKGKELGIRASIFKKKYRVDKKDS